MIKPDSEQYLPPQRYLWDRRLILVSNREPFQIKRDGVGIRIERTQGGLVSALDPVLQSCKGLWICWEGTLQSDDIDFRDFQRLAELNNVSLPYNLCPVTLTDEEIKHYYSGFANRQIWPLFHYFTSRYAFDEKDWENYIQVNQKFAHAIEQNARPGDFVWIQDYHLMLVPNMVKQSNPSCNLGFFCHIPFPHYEVFRTLPTRKEILEGILGSDLIGFHAPSYVRYFMECVEKLLPGKARLLDPNTILYDGRRIRVDAFPISIDYAKIDEIAQSPHTDEAVTQLKSLFPSVDLIGLGVDRLDYTKGILDRLECISMFFERYPDYRKRLIFIQIAVPSRTEVQEYQQMKQEIDEAVGRINGKFSEEGWAPIHYLYRGFPLEELVAYYKAADFALVNPLRDGMNLVAKEYCAAQSDNNGALILSEMTGASYQLSESFMVNPYDHPNVAKTIYEVLNTPVEEKMARMGQLREGIARDNIDKWLRNYLQAFDETIRERDGL